MEKDELLQLKETADRGDGKAAFKVAMESFDSGEMKDYFHYLAMAEELDNPAALGEYFRYFSEFENIAKDSEEMAAKLAETLPVYALHFIKHTGGMIGGLRVDTAFKLLLMAAECGSTSAVGLLGPAYQSQRAEDWYKVLADQKNPNGEVKYAQYLEDQGYSYLEPPCRDFYLDAALQGDFWADKMAEDILDVVDLQDVAGYLKAGADSGNPMWQFYYGVYLMEKGNSRTVEDENEAISCFRSAAESGIGPAVNNLGSCIVNGAGNIFDAELMDETFRLLLESAEDGNEGAQKILRDAYKTKRRKDWYMWLSEGGNLYGDYMVKVILPLRGEN